MREVGGAALLVLALLWPIEAIAQDDSMSEPWRWAHFTTATGLPSDRVHDVLETGAGVVWAITAGGLAWFDGYRWNRVEHVDGSLHWESARVTAEADGGLLVAVDGHLFRADTTRFEQIPVRLDGLPAAVTGAARLGGDSLLISVGSDLYRLDPEGGDELSRFSSPGLPPRPIRWVTRTRDGTLWIGAMRGVYRLEDGEWVPGWPPRPYRFEVRSFAVDADGRGLAYVWNPRRDRGVWEWSDTQAPVRHATEGREYVLDLDLGHDGEAVLAYTSGRVRLLSEGTWSTVPTPRPARDLLSVRFRENGDLWLGTPQGLFLFQRSSKLWSYWAHDPPDTRNHVNEILRTRDGAVWLATAGGVEVRKAGEDVRWIDRIGGRELGEVTGLAEDRQGRVWVSSGDSFEGAFHWDGERWRHVGHAAGLTAERIHKIRVDSRGDLWFLGMAELSGRGSGKEPGAFRYADGSFTRWGTREGLLDGRVYAFAETSDGAYWFGTRGGLSRWKGGMWTHWTKADGLRLNRVFALAAEGDGVWFGHEKGRAGLGFVDASGTIEYVDEISPFFGDDVTDLRVAPDGTLWVGAFGGLAAHREGVWTALRSASGLNSVRIWPVLPLDDRVYVGTMGNGTSILHLDEASRPPPRVHLVDPVVRGGRVLLRWQVDSHWGWHHPERISTRFRVDSGAWSAWSLGRSAVREGLSWGDHTLEVQAKGLLGELGPVSNTTYRVRPPPLLEPQVFVPLGVLATLVVTLGVSHWIRRRQYVAELRRNQQQLRALAAMLRENQEAERTRVTEELHDDVIESLVALKMDLARHAEPGQVGVAKAPDWVQPLLGSVDNMIETTRRTMQRIRPSVLDDLGLAEAVAWEVEEFAQRTGARCECFTDLEGTTIDADRATTLYRMLQERLDMLERRGAISRVRVRLEREGACAVLTVTDDENRLKLGNGGIENELLDVAALRERAREWGGSVSIDSDVRVGRVFTARIALSEVESSPPPAAIGGAPA